MNSVVFAVPMVDFEVFKHRLVVVRLVLFFRLETCVGVMEFVFMSQQLLKKNSNKVNRLLKRI